MVTMVIKRNGDVVGFDIKKIQNAIAKALTNSGYEGNAVERSMFIGSSIPILAGVSVKKISVDELHNIVENALMDEKEFAAAKAYVLYREKRDVERKEKELGFPVSGYIDEVCREYSLEINKTILLKEVYKNTYPGASHDEIKKAILMSARCFIEKDVSFNRLCAALLSKKINEDIAEKTKTLSFKDYLSYGVSQGLLDARLLTFDIFSHNHLFGKINFDYIGIQTIYDRYLLKDRNGNVFETPEYMFMRIAMGLALNEKDKNQKAIEFYKVLSSFDFMSSTPTLFNAGTTHPQLSSCYLSTVDDSLKGIFDFTGENAVLSKHAGGLGMDFSPVRGMGAKINGTNGKSQGVVPFLKIVNDMVIAVNQCFHPKTKIYTSNGLKEIQDISKSDLVLGISGKYRDVIDVLKYEQKEKMVEIDIKHSIDKIQVSDNHPFYAIQNIPVGQDISRTVNQIKNGKANISWVESSKLKKGDYVAQVMPTEIVHINDFSEEDARIYGILLGDGWLSKDGSQWGVSGNPKTKKYLEFVKCYLSKRGIHYWISNKNENCCSINWSSGFGVGRDEKTGVFTKSTKKTMPFEYSDIYNESGKKRIASKFMHLPINQTILLIRGLIESDGNISRKKEITFCSSSNELAENIRYQCLRIGVATSGSYKKQKQNHIGTRCDGKKIFFNGDCESYTVRIPAIKEISTFFNCAPITKKNWITHNGFLFSRVKSVNNIEKTDVVYDLLVDVDESYMTTSCLAHNGGKRKGSACVYLETWHLDIEEFLELRKNTGDDRRRTHDMNTANWIPDLFMKRQMADKEWTLFSPDECPDLHDLYGKKFESAYEKYEEKAKNGEIKNFKVVSAKKLWQKMMTMLFETGHPWITFKDACNVRSPQQHVGTVHSSNLCTEITLNTSEDEIAVCNLGSVNLKNHLTKNSYGSIILDMPKLEKTISTAMRMLDNVIDINYYPVEKAKKSNMRHRPVGLGMMGFQDCLYEMRIPYDSHAAVEFADAATEAVCYFAYLASSNLAKERGTYKTYDGSLWSKGILPQDTINMLSEQRGGWVDCDKSETIGWFNVIDSIKEHGMRNSNCVAIAPTATISNITGVSASIEPTYQNLYVKSNLSGEFTIINEYLIKDLEKLGILDDLMIIEIKENDGSIQNIDRIPNDLKRIYKTAFEIDPVWLIECAARRQKWIDQAQSLNIYMTGASGKKMSAMYELAWMRGLKTTYYFRSLGATSAEKSTISTGALNQVKSCSLENKNDCEACQ